MKFLLIHYREKQLTLLARADNGMYIGSTNQNMAVFGEDQATATRRIFIDRDCALAWLKQQAIASCEPVDLSQIPLSPEQQYHLKEVGPLQFYRELDASQWQFEDREGDSRIVIPNAGGLQ